LSSSEGKPLSGLWPNSGTPYALAAGVMNELLQRGDCLHVETIDLGQTMNIAAWRTASGELRILAGNLEEGLHDDADMSRHATLVLPRSWRTTKWTDAWSGRPLDLGNKAITLDLGQGSSVLLEPAHLHWVGTRAGASRQQLRSPVESR
jgi:hypothetical protein